VIPSSGSYYSALGRSEKCFERAPILTLSQDRATTAGRPAEGALFEPKLFERQLVELREAGFQCAIGKRARTKRTTARVTSF
jgi:hypothetical protein